MMHDDEIGGSPFMEIMPRRGGRPRAFDEPGASLTVWLPTQTYDRLTHIANVQHISLSALVRQMLLVQLKRNP